MKPIIDILSERIINAMADATGQADCDAIVTPATDSKFGDYQANGVMALAKKLKTNPRKLAEQVVEKLDIADICEPAEIAGPGFINLRLRAQYLGEKVLEMNADTNRLAVDQIQNPKTIVVDFSSPNIAKQMHVGHLRSTIIGDCICRMLEFQGHKVIRQNHIGDWGTQFGMLICYFYREHGDRLKNGNLKVSDMSIPNMEDFYREAKRLFDTDSDFASESREYVVKLQSGDHQILGIWQLIRGQSIHYCQDIYWRLKVDLEEKHVKGESEYNDMLPGVVEDLKEHGKAKESDGAICAFPEGFTNKEGEPLPFIIQKTDGAFLYATTDLAAIRYRVGQLKADKIIYVTDARQALHFQMLFATARDAGWAAEDVELMHVTFGTMLGADNKPFKTRTGGTVKLGDLLDEAVERAKAVVEAKNPQLDDDKKAEIAKAVGIGAVKYSDYSNNRNSDYVFSFDKMLAMEGNTAPYMQYAYARVRSIERKAEAKGVDITGDLKGIRTVNLEDSAEKELAKHLLRYSEAIRDALADCRPNFLTTYLYDLAQKFSTFYNACHVLGADESQRPTRVLLCDLTARTIKHGLTELLGIEVVEQM